MTAAVPEAEAHEHSHADVSGGWLRAAVFGAMDGLVTNTALVAGVGGGGAAPRAIVLAGTASLVAGAISMALGEYTSVKTQNEQLDLEVEKERRELERNPEGSSPSSPRCCGCAAWTTGSPTRSPCSCLATRRRLCACTSSPSSG
ncbi:VIT1/CCC1 transporter family protein [Blastococcus brunescens]|uniref:VIT1/CCC1 transporter family protein n=1 Tax=Blastococcus brunescens TaxID=1564165 RepID=A0ABZ1AZP4_9ACTN|nr:VIT1/CCC1 transporter family protein [Blastococcus sp. BMG 8361]WRL62524.1 VIT1/CCC1 transporter family protein [Blastococcus sp. BMG 8361]